MAAGPLPTTQRSGFSVRLIPAVGVFSLTMLSMTLSTRERLPTQGVSSCRKKARAMPRPSKTQSLPVKLAGHLAMGGVLGTALAVSLIVMNARNILDLIALSASPWMTGMVFVSIFALFCAVGATLTGLIFILAEEDET